MLITQSYRIGHKSNISLAVFSPGSAKTNVGWGEKLNIHLMASCIRNIRSKNYGNLIIAFQVTFENVGDAFLRHSAQIYRETKPALL